MRGRSVSHVAALAEIAVVSLMGAAFHIS